MPQIGVRTTYSPMQAVVRHGRGVIVPVPPGSHAARRQYLITQKLSLFWSLVGIPTGSSTTAPGFLFFSREISVLSYSTSSLFLYVLLAYERAGGVSRKLCLESNVVAWRSHCQGSFTLRCLHRIWLEPIGWVSCGMFPIYIDDPNSYNLPTSMSHNPTQDY